MATTTFTAAAFNQQPRQLFDGVNSVTATINTLAISASGASTVFFAKIPKGATILEVIEHHTTGAATCPADLGYDGTLSAFISAGAAGGILRLTTAVSVGLQIPAQTTTATGYVKLIGTYTPGTATASLIAAVTVLYTMDRDAR